MSLFLRQRETHFDYALLYREQEKKLQKFIQQLYQRSPFYRQKLEDARIRPEQIKTIQDLAMVPFTTKAELRSVYPLGMQAVPDEEVVRIHSSSGTTGKAIIVPYTSGDVATWAEMMARCMELTGVTKKDRVQVTPGYGLWTAGIGFQAGVEQLGAMAIPTGPGNTEKQLELMEDLQTTVIVGTSSYGLLLAEEIHKRGLQSRLNLQKGIFGSERWGDKMRRRIEELLDIDTFDIYGLTEIYGPGIAIDCSYHQGMHFWSDHLLFEIIDPVSGQPLPPGEQGELVITTLSKEGMPLLRYRTHDITRLRTDSCPCGSPFPKIDRILGRTDDMVKVKGVNIYPGQIDHVLKQTEGAGSEYQLILTRSEGKDRILVKLEAQEGAEIEKVAQDIKRNMKTSIGIQSDVSVVPYGSLPRVEKKSKRVYDLRENNN